MRFDLIEKVEFRHLDEKRYDRRGTIAVFYLKGIPNEKYLYVQAAIAIRNMIGLLHDHFDMNWYDMATVEAYALDEAQDCWVSQSIHEKHALVLNHKYWGKEQIEAFYKIVQAVADLHNWEIVDNRKDG